MHIVIGFDSVKQNAKSSLIYSGASKGDALEAMQTPPNGIVRAELYSHPLPNKRKIYAVKKAAKKSAKK